MPDLRGMGEPNFMVMMGKLKFITLMGKLTSN